MTTTDNGDTKTKSTTSHEPHDWRGPQQTSQLEAVAPYKDPQVGIEAGIFPSGVPVPADVSVTIQAKRAKVSGQPLAQVYSVCTQPRSLVYCEQHMPRPPVVLGACKSFADLVDSSTLNRVKGFEEWILCAGTFAEIQEGLQVGLVQGCQQVGEPNHVQVRAVHQAVDVGQTFGSGVTSVGTQHGFPRWS